MPLQLPNTAAMLAQSASLKRANRAANIAALRDFAEYLSAVSKQDEEGLCLQLNRSGQLQEMTEVDVAIPLVKGNERFTLERLRLTVLGQTVLALEIYSGELEWVSLGALQTRGWQFDCVGMDPAVLEAAFQSLAEKLHSGLGAFQKANVGEDIQRAAPPTDAPLN